MRWWTATDPCWMRSCVDCWLDHRPAQLRRCRIKPAPQNSAAGKCQGVNRACAIPFPAAGRKGNKERPGANTPGRFCPPAVRRGGAARGFLPAGCPWLAGCPWRLSPCGPLFQAASGRPKPLSGLQRVKGHLQQKGHAGLKAALIDAEFAAVLRVVAAAAQHGKGAGDHRGVLGKILRPH